MSEGCRKITHGLQSHEVLVLTHEGNARAFTFALIRDTPHFITRVVLHKRTVKSLSGLLRSREYLSVCAIYCAALQIQMWFVRENVRPLNSWSQQAHIVYVGALFEKWPCQNEQQSKIVKKSLKKQTYAKHHPHLQSKLVKTQGRWLLGFYYQPLVTLLGKTQTLHADRHSFCHLEVTG